MSFLDKLVNQTKRTMASSITSSITSTIKNSAQKNSDGLAHASSVSVVLNGIPNSLEELKSMDGADLKNENKVAALIVAALCVYSKNSELGIEMLNFLKGPKPLSNYDKQFLADRFRDKEYLATSYLEGATYENNYEPSMPLTVKVYKTSYSDDQLSDGYIKVYLKSGGADTARHLQLRKKDSTQEWFLWENFLLADIRKPKKEDEWA